MDSPIAHFIGEETEAQGFTILAPKHTASSWRPGQDALECTPLNSSWSVFQIVFVCLFKDGGSA